MNKSSSNKSSIDTINLQLALMFLLGDVFGQITVGQIKYHNNIIEQVKKITKPKKRFNASFHSAETTLPGLELYHMHRKGQY
jgi:transposase-like protein